MATYTASSAVIANPERGFFQYTESHRKDDGTGYTPLSASTLSAARTGTSSINNINFAGLSIVFRYFYMEKYKTTATIEQQYLDMIAADLAAVRSAGCKIIIRFAYYAGQNSDDATPAIVQGHINQLAPVINQYADVVHALEAGMIGAWGEWYYTNNFGDQGNLTSQNVSDRNAVIDSWLNKLDSRIFVLLRYMGTRQTYLNSTASNPGGNAARLGHHNDAFTAPYANYGTYTTFSTQSESANRSYLAGINNVPVGGESANYNSPDSDWANASQDLANYHWSFLNPNYYQQTIGVWGQSNCDIASQKLGYRLRMVSSSIPSSMNGGSSYTVQVVVTNDGYAPPVRNRPVQFVFDDGNGHTSTTAFSTDIRTWAPGQQVTLSMNVTAPSTNATYNTYLVLPDASSAISNNAVYNIQMANTNTWDAGTGRNSLASPVTVVNGSGAASPSATLSNVSTNATVGGSVTGTLDLSNTSSAYLVLYTGGGEQGSRVQSSGGSFSLSPSAAGTYTVRAYTVSSGGTLLAESPTITVGAASSPTASITVSSTSVASGSQISGTLTLSNTSTGYLSLYTNGAEAGGRTGAAAGSWALTPSGTGTYTVRVYSSNTGGSLLAESPQVTVSSSSSVTASFNGVSTSVVVGNPVSGNVIFNGASNGYITLATGGSEYSPRVSLGTGGFSITPNSTGTFTVRAYANATGGSILAESPNIAVTSSSSPSGSFSGVPASVVVNNPISASLSLTNISSAYITLVVNGGEQGARVQVNAGSFAITPTSTGSYVLRAFTAASGGTQIAESPAIDVTSSPSGTVSANLSNVPTSITLGSGISATLGLTNTSSAYVVLYTGGAEQGGRVQAAAGSITLTPSAAGSYTIRVYTASSGGTLLTESGPVTVNAGGGTGGTALKAVFKVTVGGVTKVVKRVG